MALAGARVFAQRKGRSKATKVMVFHGGYHGGVLYFVSGGSPVNMPYQYVVGPYNDIEGARKLLAEQGEGDLRCARRADAGQPTAACRAMSAS